MIGVFIPGVPTPWARARRQGEKHFIAGPQANYGTTVRDYVHRAMGGRKPFTGPVRLIAVANYPWPASYSKKRRAAIDGAWKFTKPDLDNVTIKLVADNLIGVAFLDDGQIAYGVLVKLYSDEPPGLTLTIESLVGVAPFFTLLQESP